ncbi:hypothetical protein [Tabrizicola sp.]|jgi:hypothetical protein|uniref:hypothetical protein n=1 Tax=Tabrizicola sp. TaxID=2005166 RepID=UPI0035B286C6
MAPTKETGMALGLVIIAMLGATGVTAALFAYGFPLWIVLLAYPLTGTIILLPGVALFGWIRQHPPSAGPDGLLTSRSPAAPHSQSPAGSSNP